MSKMQELSETYPESRTDIRVLQEKAKAYDEALEKARQLCAYPTSKPFISDLQDLFPELKESEGERIRKTLVAVVNLYYGEGEDEEKTACLAWLEKQNESYTKRDVDDAYLKGVTNTKNEIEKQYEANYQIRKDIATFIFNYKGDIKDRAKWIDYLGIKVSFAEKQGEQKLNPCENCGIATHNCQKFPCAIRDGEQKPADNVEPKFNIGDVIKRGLSTLRISAKNFRKNFYELTTKEGNVVCCVPFSEQDGWELVAKNTTVRPIYCVMSDSPYCPYYNKQNPAEWSEKNESFIRYLIECLEHCKKGVSLTMTRPTAQEYIDWLKSLRHQNTWKPSDEQIKSLQESIGIVGELTPRGELLQELAEQLKKLRKE